MIRGSGTGKATRRVIQYVQGKSNLLKPETLEAKNGPQNGRKWPENSRKWNNQKKICHFWPLLPIFGHFPAIFGPFSAICGPFLPPFLGPFGALGALKGRGEPAHRNVFWLRFRPFGCHFSAFRAETEDRYFFDFEAILGHFGTFLDLFWRQKRPFLRR